MRFALYSPFILIIYLFYVNLLFIFIHLIFFFPFTKSFWHTRFPLDIHILYHKYNEMKNKHWKKNQRIKKKKNLVNLYFCLHSTISRIYVYVSHNLSHPKQKKM